MDKLRVSVGGVDLATPLVLASGCAGYGTEWGELVAWEAVGAVVLKGVSRTPWHGNVPPRITEVPGGVINAIGLENVGLDVFLNEKLPALESFPAKIIANVVGRTAEEYVHCCAALNGHDRVDGVEVNVSCPNVKQGGMTFGAEAGGLRSLIRDCRDVTQKPLWVKLTPMVGDIIPIAKAAAAAGADALTIANTVPAMAIDVHKRAPVLGNVYGGLSGPAIAPINLRLVRRVHQAVKIDIVGSGGVDRWETAAAYLLAGARAVQLGTVLFADPAAVAAIAAGLDDFLTRQQFENVAAAVGALITE